MTRADTPSIERKGILCLRKGTDTDMKLKFSALLLTFVMLLSLLAGCTGGDNPSAGVPDSLPAVSGSTASTDAPDHYVLRVGTLKGPTGMGMAKIITDNETEKKYEFTLSSAPTDISAALISGSLDIAAVPVNLAAVINAKTEGKYLVAAINTLGVLYILENGSSVQSIADLAGKTLYATGQASTPEYMLNYILKKNNLDTVTVEYKTEHSELATLMASGEVVLGMLPEPNVTTVLSKNDKLRIALNLTEEWKKVSEGEAVQGCIVVSRDAIRDHKALVDRFLDEYKASVDFVNQNVKEAAAMIAELEIVPAAAVAEKAIPNCNIVYIDGDEMIRSLSAFYRVLYDASPSSIGEKLPDETLYYKK